MPLTFVNTFLCMSYYIILFIMRNDTSIIFSYLFLIFVFMFLSLGYGWGWGRVGNEQRQRTSSQPTRTTKLRTLLDTVTLFIVFVV